MKLKELKGSEFGYEVAAFRAPENVQYPEPLASMGGDEIYSVALEWRPTFVFDTEAEKGFLPDELTFTPIVPLSFAAVNEASSYETTVDGSVTRYSLLSRFQGPHLNVGARYQVAPEFFVPEADVQIGASVTAGVNAYGNLIEESTVSDGVARRTFDYQAAGASLDVAAQGELQINVLTFRGGVTWDSQLGVAPIIGASLDMNAVGRTLHRVFLKDK